jgi:hypothetical protein
LVRTTGRLEPAGSDDLLPEGSIDEHSRRRRLGVATSSGDIWTVTESTYHLELWDSHGLEKIRSLALHPAILNYLLAPYSDLRIVSAHLVADRYLWVFLRAENRYPDPSADGSERSRFLSTYDGFVEVVDLEESAVVASRFLPDLDLDGWVSGPIGYRRTAQGGLELVHCAVEMDRRSRHE